MILMREFHDSDVLEISKIHSKQPELGIPSLRNVLVNSTFEDETGKVIGYGVVKIFAEITLIVDNETSKKNKVSIIRRGLDLAMKVCKRNKIEQLYAITSFPGFAKILERHYNARICPDTLLIELGE